MRERRLSGEQEDPVQVGIKRRRAAKRTNERLKLLSVFFSNGAVAMFAAGIFGPLTRLHDILIDRFTVLWLIAAVALHIMGQMVLGMLQSEE